MQRVTKDQSSFWIVEHFDKHQKVCMEILNLTTRCFGQSFETKQELYLGNFKAKTVTAIIIYVCCLLLIFIVFFVCFRTSFCNSE